MNSQVTRLFVLSTPIFLVLCGSLCLAQDSHPIIGTWEWLFTESCTGEISNPQTEGFTIQRQFGELGQENNYRIYRNEALLFRGHYAISYVWINDTHIEILTIQQDSQEESLTFGFLIGDQLVLADLETDCPFAFYVRRGPVSAENTTWGGMKSQYR